MCLWFFFLCLQSIPPSWVVVQITSSFNFFATHLTIIAGLHRTFHTEYCACLCVKLWQEFTIVSHMLSFVFLQIVFIHVPIRTSFTSFTILERCKNLLFWCVKLSRIYCSSTSITLYPLCFFKSFITMYPLEQHLQTSQFQCDVPHL